MFESDPSVVQGEVVEPLDTSTALEAINRSEIDIQITTAKRFPRSVDTFKKEALSLATLDEDTAGSMFYAVPRAGKTIEGPSVRLAEIVASTWQNIRVGARIVSIDEKFVTAQGAAMDLEKNMAATVEVKRRITNKHGVRFKDDMIQTTCNAACSIAMRQAIFKVVPFAFVKPIYDEARRVAIGDAKTLVNKRAGMIAYFAKMGVEEPRVLALVEKASIEDVGLSELAVLKGVATAIKEGSTNVDDAFPAVDTEGGKVAETFNTPAAKKDDKPKPEDAPPEEAGIIRAEWREAFLACETPEQSDALVAKSKYIDALSGEMKAEIVEMGKERSAELSGGQ
jgi:hypothetical protein